MKVVVNPSEKDNKPEYPRLMQSIYTSDIVLFLKKEHGTIIHSKQYPTGHYSKKWSMECFEPFTGTVELSND